MKSFLSYLGGKSILAGQIINKIPEHTCYCEVFAGAAWMLFKKDESEVEIINDINNNLITLYRVIKLHLEEFIRYLKWVLVSREEFERFKAENPESLTDIQRAVRFYYLLKNGYASKIDNPYFAVSAIKKPAFNLLRIEEELSMAHLRLSRVYIENMHYQKCIEKFDKEKTFFYLDPPYYNCENYYGKNIFFKEDFIKLKDLLKALKGKFIMSLNNTKEVLEIYKDFNIEEVKTRYSTSNLNNHSKNVTEILIRNF